MKKTSKVLLAIFMVAIIFSFGVNKSFTQTNDEQFNTFFQKFKNAVKNNNIYEVTELTNFPFIWAWGAVENQVSKDSFISNTNIPYIPGYDILTKAKFNETITISEDKYEEETVDFEYTEGYYIISWGLWNSNENYGGYGEYYFGLINDEYKYIKQLSGD